MFNQNQPLSSLDALAEVLRARGRQQQQTGGEHEQNPDSSHQHRGPPPQASSSAAGALEQQQQIQQQTLLNLQKEMLLSHALSGSTGGSSEVSAYYLASLNQQAPASAADILLGGGGGPAQAGVNNPTTNALLAQLGQEAAIATSLLGRYSLRGGQTDFASAAPMLPPAAMSSTSTAGRLLAQVALPDASKSEQSATLPTKAASSSSETPTAKPSGTFQFPHKLYDVLMASEEEGPENFQSVISWSPWGDGFKLHDSEKFAELIMPRFFRMKQLKSFNRQLNLYNFRRITSGPYKVSVTNKAYAPVLLLAVCITYPPSSSSHHVAVQTVIREDILTRFFRKVIGSCVSLSFGKLTRRDLRPLTRRKTACQCHLEDQLLRELPITGG